MSRMFECELRVRCLLRHQVLEFTRTIHLPFQPCPCLFYHDGPPPNTSLRFREVGWLADEDKFLVRTDDDVDAASEFGDDVASLVNWYESLGWEFYNAGPIAFVVVHQPEDGDDEDTLLEEDCADVQDFPSGESA